MGIKQARKFLHTLKIELSGLEEWVNRTKDLIDKIDDQLMDAEDAKSDREWKTKIKKYTDENKSI